MLEKDQKRIRWQGQLTSSLARKRRKQTSKERRWVFLAMHRPTLPTYEAMRGLLGTLQHLCHAARTCRARGTAPSTSTLILLPRSIQQTLLWQQLGFASQRSSSLGCHPWGREARLGAGLPWLSKSDRFQGDGGPSRRWVTDVHVASGCLWGWEVKHRGAAPSTSTVWSRHSSPSLLLPQHRPFYLFLFARLHGPCCAKNVQKHADDGLFPLRTWSLLQVLEVNTEKESPES